jgi:hypothetical protein
MIYIYFGYIVYSTDMGLMISDLPCGSDEALDILKIPSSLPSPLYSSYELVFNITCKTWVGAVLFFF